MLPDIRAHAVAVSERGAADGQAGAILGAWLAEVIRANPDSFRIFGPDETAWDRLAPAVNAATGKQWNAIIDPVRQQLEDARAAARRYTGQEGVDIPVVNDWRWPSGELSARAGTDAP